VCVSKRERERERVSKRATERDNVREIEVESINKGEEESVSERESDTKGDKKKQKQLKSGLGTHMLHTHQIAILMQRERDTHNYN